MASLFSFSISYPMMILLIVYYLFVLLISYIISLFVAEINPFSEFLSFGNASYINKIILTSVPTTVTISHSFFIIFSSSAFILCWLENRFIFYPKPVAVFRILSHLFQYPYHPSSFDNVHTSFLSFLFPCRQLINPV